MPAIPGNLLACLTAFSDFTSPVMMQPDWAPFSRIMRVSLRVSMSAIATVSLCFRKSLNVRSLRQLLVTRELSRMIRPDACTCRGLHVLGIRAGIADVRISERDDLATVGRIREDLLVAGHRGVEDDFTDGLAVGTHRGALEYGAIL